MVLLQEQAVPSFGIFEQLANYGALGLAVLGLGFVAWFLFKRNLDEQDRMKRKMEELERQSFIPVDTNRAAAIQEQAVVAKMAPAKKPRAKKQ
jgi:hypothetical protein